MKGHAESVLATVAMMSRAMLGSVPKYSWCIVSEDWLRAGIQRVKHTVQWL